MKKEENIGRASRGRVPDKRESGRYYTQENPFDHRGFAEWAAQCRLASVPILEPFAGSNNLIKMLGDMGWCGAPHAPARSPAPAPASYDIMPVSAGVKKRDTLKNFPKGFGVCITNPPYLARNSAKRRGLHYPDTQYDDLYKYALAKCLDHCGHVGAIIPASFLNSGLFRNRLAYYIMLNSKMFDDTDHPVCLALFTPRADEVTLYEGRRYLGKLSALENRRGRIAAARPLPMRFNAPRGALGLYALDNTLAPSIAFCAGEEIAPGRVNVSSRSITRIALPCKPTRGFIKKLNAALAAFRADTHDVFLTPFKGIRRDRRFRRRLDFAMARDIISHVASSPY